MIKFNGRRSIAMIIIYVLYLLCCASAVYFGINVVVAGNSTYFLFGGLIAFAGIIIAFLLVFQLVKTYYVFTDNELNLVSGKDKMTLPFNSIFAYKKCKKIFKKYGLAIHRIELSYKDIKNNYEDRYYIAVKDENAFISELKKHCKNIKNLDK